MTVRQLKTIFLLGSCLFITGCFESETSQSTDISKIDEKTSIQEFAQNLNIGQVGHEKPVLGNPFTGMNLAGQYLASQFAQNHHDWKTASEYLGNILEIMPGQTDLVKKSMILAAGSGDIDTAVILAKQLEESDDTGALAPLFEFSALFKEKKYQEADSYIETMPHAGLADFIYPLLRGWTQAALGNFDIESLQTNTIHLKHAILISDYLKHEDQIENLLLKSISAQNISLDEVETIADGFARIGKTEQAEKLYHEVLKQAQDNEHIARKLDTLKEAPKTVFSSVKGPEEGMSRAIYDMAKLLYQENSDDSARIFAHLARYIDPDNQEASLLLGTIAAKNNQYIEAITYYTSIHKNHESYLEAQRIAAEIMAQNGEIDKALTVLHKLFKNYHDVRSLIAVGDIHRKNEQYRDAISAYDQAEDVLKSDKHQEDLSSNFWHIHYVRGMAQEQAGNWGAAESDLKAALEIEPEHPFVLNYLGYAWADKGIHLEDSLDMIQKAAALQPDDGYIVDSLGWVYYKMGRFSEAISQLERASQILPYDPTINDHLGDAYWHAGRKLEARFQWERAINHSDDEKLISKIEQKITNGLAEAKVSKHAQASQSSEL